MSSGPDQVTSTTKTEPSPMLVPGIQTAANSALGQFTGGGQQYGSAGTGWMPPSMNNPSLFNRFGAALGSKYGQSFVPDYGFVGPGTYNPAQPSMGNPNFMGNTNVTGGVSTPANAGYAALAQRGRQGSPLVDNASRLTNQTLSGRFLSPDTNPYLEQTFNRAADLTRTRLDTEFAGAGRSLGAAMPARSEELQTLASNIFGQNYARERGLQQGAINAALPLANQDYTDINARIDAGNLPLDTLINRISALAPAAGGTAISSQPIQGRSPLAGGLGGAMGGFALGNALFPGAGGLVGAGLGGLAGLLG